MVSRLIGDFDRLAPGLRRAVNFRDAQAVHSAAGCFLHFLRILQHMAPAAFYEECRESLHSQFMQGFLDPDLCHILTVQVPPGDIKGLSAFRRLDTTSSFGEHMRGWLQLTVIAFTIFD